MASLKEILSKFLTIQGISVALVVGRDGLLIEGTATAEDSDLEAISAVTSTGLQAAEALSQEIAKGNCIGTVMEYEHGLVSVTPLGEFAVFVTLSDKATNLGRIRIAVRNSRQELIKALEAL